MENFIFCAVSFHASAPIFHSPILPLERVFKQVKALDLCQKVTGLNSTGCLARLWNLTLLQGCW